MAEDGIRTQSGTRAILAERFPAAILARTRGRGRSKKPLALNIDKALIAACPDLTKTQIGRFLAAYTAKPSYLRALVRPGAMRIDLAGAEVEPVSEDHARHAAHMLAEHMAANGRPPESHTEKAA